MTKQIVRDNPATLNGITVAIAKRLCRYAFGEHYCYLRQVFLEFRVTLYDNIPDGNGQYLSLDRNVVDDFTEYWGKEFFKIEVIKR
jgi:hypothetical protein